MTVLRRFAEVRKLQPYASARQALETAQDVLPLGRRRPVYPPLVTWANKAVTELPPAPPDPPVRMELDSATTMGEAPPAEIVDEDKVTSPLIAYGIRAGATVLTGILKDPQVQRAVAELLADVLRQGAMPTEASRLAPPGPAQDPPSVTILGLTEQQSSEFARAYRGLMTLRFDRGDGVTQALRDAVGASDVVIAMDGSVAQEVSRLLHRLAPSYVRHTNGLAGLRTRLADLAMTHGSASPGAADRK